MRAGAQPDDWWAVLKFGSRGAAEAVAAILEAEAVPTVVDACQLAAGVDSHFVLSVPRSLVHRAKWILAHSELSDGELNYLATREARPCRHGRALPAPGRIWHGASMSRIVAIVVRELREALPATLFFFLAFHMIMVTKTVLLAEYHVNAAGSAVATVAALIVAKAILIVEKLPLARLFSRPMLYNVLWKTFLFGLVATLFRLLEELVPRVARHEGAFGTAIEESFGGVSWDHFWVVQMWLFALLFLYCLAAELTRVIGPHEVKAMLLSSNRST